MFISTHNVPASGKKTIAMIDLFMTHIPDPNHNPLSQLQGEFPEKGLMYNKPAFFLGAGAIVAGLYFTSLYHYLLFHSLVEIYCATIAFAIFMVAWNSRNFGNNPYLIVIGTAYLSIGFLDILHTLSYKGIPVFTDYDYYANQVWIAIRYVESVALVAGLFTLRRKKKIDPYLLLVFNIVLTAALVELIFTLKAFPVCYVEGQGQTVFKKVSEGVVCAILGSGLYLLYRERNFFSAMVYRQIQWAMITTIASGTAFTLYVDNYGLFNLLGHYFKLTSFYLIYRAIIQTGIIIPYSHVFHELKARESELQKQALMDELTGLYNRRAAFMFLRKTLSRSERAEKPCTVCYLDVDSLKTINDCFGHKEGDRVIRAIGHAIIAGIREMDYGCRIGGDEFLMVFPECREEQVLPIIERVKAHLQENLKDRLWEFPVNFSFGLSEYKGYGAPDVDRIIESADNRMYKNKENAKRVRTTTDECK